MSGYLRPMLAVIAFGLFVGLLLGVAFGLFVVPVNWVDSDIAHLRSAQKDDWVFMVGAAYALDGNLADAAQRVSRLDSEPAFAAKYVADVAQRAIDRNDTRNAKNAAALAVALGVGTPAMRQYLQTETAPAPTAKP